MSRSSGFPFPRPGVCAEEVRAWAEENGYSFASPGVETGKVDRLDTNALLSEYAVALGLAKTGGEA